MQPPRPCVTSVSASTSLRWSGWPPSCGAKSRPPWRWPGWTGGPDARRGPGATLDADSGGGGWTLRAVLGHVLFVERSYQLQTACAASPADGEPIRREPDVPHEDASTVAAWLERRSAAREEGRKLAAIADGRLARQRIWTGHAVDVRFRLHRFTGHLRPGV